MHLDAIPSNFMASIPAHLDSEAAADGSKPKFDLPPSHLDGGNTPFASTEPSQLA